MLQQLIESDDDATTSHLKQVSQGQDGVLARDAEKDRFEIISDEELQHILNGTDSEYEAKRAAVVDEPMVESVDEAEELELVSTQMLRQILSPDDFSESDDDESGASGFDPYNHT